MRTDSYLSIGHTYSLVLRHSSAIPTPCWTAYRWLLKRRGQLGSKEKRNVEKLCVARKMTAVIGEGNSDKIGRRQPMWNHTKKALVYLIYFWYQHDCHLRRVINQKCLSTPFISPLSVLNPTHEKKLSTSCDARTG